MTTVKFLRHVPASKQKRAGWHAVLSHTHTYSGRADHGGTVKPPESYEKLVQWAKRLDIAAVGMGSPYTPETARQYDLYDGEGRGNYYRGGFDSIAVRGDEEIDTMLEQVNELAGKSPLFFLDNETPKGRYGHLWWVNYALDFPAWHDYDQDFDRWMMHQSRAGDDSAEPMPYLRRPYREIVAAQRARGALANWAHPTSWWPGDQGQFITNIASEMPAHLIADGYLDGLVVMGYHAYRPEYQQLWFHLLDCGYRVPGVAEMDTGLSDAGLWKKDSAYLTLIHSKCQPGNAAEVAAAWRTGRIIASSGAWVEIEVDGVPMGGVASTEKLRRHDITAHFGGPAEHYDVEILGCGGEVLWSGHDLEAGTVHLAAMGGNSRTYLLARVFAVNAAEKSRDTGVCAVCNPVYLHPRGMGFEPPAITRLTLKFSPVSPWLGGRVRLETAAGELVDESPIRQGCTEHSAPAGGRLTLVAEGRPAQTVYLINANTDLIEVQRYLYRGRFLKDFPDLKPGELPPQAWRFEQYQQAMKTLTLTF